ncbi:MAG: MiaB/RimO family radical SAM methylthiotransferase, partial [Spirochaetota bacterium]|nr:MiaB/RimO family radical SAM methylthiotransferase [Spirochaetota bacterium]
MDRTFSIKTLGCKVNQYESSIIVDQFYENGWIPKSFGERADIVIINTCTVTERSDKKCRNYIRQGTRFSKSGKILVTGCLVDRDLDGLRRMPGVSAVFKNDEKNAILASANKSYELMNYSEGIPLSSRFDDCQPDNSQKNFHKKYQPETLSPHLRRRGFIKIQDGCDGVCAYCIVPTVRGAPRSRGYHEILEHSRRLIDIGCPELILTGISIGRYFDEDRDLAKLIEDIITLDGKFRVRISSIEPNHINAKLIDLFGSERLCPHIHLPLQSGSDRILQMMKRPYTVGDYIKIVEKIKSIYQNIAVGTDIIVGFPEENE